MRCNALTIDVEDWFQLAYQKLCGQDIPASGRVVDNTRWLLEVLAEYNVRATFFVLGMVARQHPMLVREIASAGHEVATHGFAHRCIHAQTQEAFEADLRRSIWLLEDIVQQPVWGHRAAEFSVGTKTPWVFEALVAAGLRYDSSLFPIRHPRYGVPHAPRLPHIISTPQGPLVEFPPATMRLFRQNIPVAGGGYLRFFPPALIRAGIRQLNRQGQIAVLYVHPYEFDEEWLDLPVPAASLSRRMYLRWRAWKRNWRRGHPMRIRFRQLLREFPFVPLREVLDEYGTGEDTAVFSTPCSPV